MSLRKVYIAISTKNLKKIDALKKVLQKFSLDWNIVVACVDSNVDDSPLDNAISLGAYNRCQNLKKVIDANYYVSIETGMSRRGYHNSLYIETWAGLASGIKYYDAYSSGTLVPKQIDDDVKGMNYQQLCQYIDTKKIGHDFTSLVTNEKYDRSIGFMEALEKVFLAAGFRFISEN